MASRKTSMGYDRTTYGKIDNITLPQPVYFQFHRVGVFLLVGRA
jgi:hypothetical protein